MCNLHPTGSSIKWKKTVGKIVKKVCHCSKNIKLSKVVKRNKGPKEMSQSRDHNRQKDQTPFCLMTVLHELFISENDS